MTRSLKITTAIVGSSLLSLSLASAARIDLIDEKQATFIDVPSTAWYAPYVETVAEAGIVQGYRDSNGKLTGEYGPERPVTRAEFLKMVVMTLVHQQFDQRAAPPGSSWYAPYLEAMKANDPELNLVMPDYGEELDKPILRHEAAGLLYAGLDISRVTPWNPLPFPDVDPAEENFHLAFNLNPILELHGYGVITGDKDTGNFNPFRTLNRAEAAKMLVKTADAYHVPLGPNGVQISSSESITIQYGMLNPPAAAIANYSRNTVYRYTVTAPPKEGVTITNQAFGLVGGRWSAPQLEFFSDAGFANLVTIWESIDSYDHHRETLDDATTLQGTLIVPAGKTRYIQLTVKVGTPADSSSLRVKHFALPSVSLHIEPFSTPVH